MNKMCIWFTCFRFFQAEVIAACVQMENFWRSTALWSALECIPGSWPTKDSCLLLYFLFVPVSLRSSSAFQRGYGASPSKLTIKADLPRAQVCNMAGSATCQVPIQGPPGSPAGTGEAPACLENGQKGTQPGNSSPHWC